jgi:phage baseplate assembly protein W
MAIADNIGKNGVQKNLYSDFLNNLNPHPNTKSLVVSKNTESVRRAIRNLILTNKYERPYNPKFGGNIRKYLFEQATPQTAFSIKEDIKQIVKNYEPRARVEDVIVSAFPDDNAYAITIIFSVRNETNPVRLDLTLYRVR